MPVSDRIGAGDPENRCGRPTVLLEIRRLIRKMSIANPLWKRRLGRWSKFGSCLGYPFFEINAVSSTPLPVDDLFATQGNVTWSEQMTDDGFLDLGELEQAVMQLIWAGRPMTAEIVREQLPRRLKESTVRTVLRRLEEKGYVTHTVDGRTYVFQATEARGRVAAKAVRRIVDRFCNGSVEEVLVGMVDAKMFDRRQLDMLKEKIEKAKKKR